MDESCGSGQEVSRKRCRALGFHTGTACEAGGGLGDRGVGEPRWCLLLEDMAPPSSWGHAAVRLPAPVHTAQLPSTQICASGEAGGDGVPVCPAGSLLLSEAADSLVQSPTLFSVITQPNPRAGDSSKLCRRCRRVPAVSVPAGPLRRAARGRELPRGSEQSCLPLKTCVR